MSVGEVEQYRAERRVRWNIRVDAIFRRIEGGGCGGDGGAMWRLRGLLVRSQSRIERTVLLVMSTVPNIGKFGLGCWFRNNNADGKRSAMAVFQ